MAEEKKTPQEKAAAPKKTAVKKRATAKKRPAPKKTAAKKSAAKKAAPIHAEKTARVEESTIHVTLQTAESTRQSQPPFASGKPDPARHIWWRAALMLGVVILIFAYIRDAAQTGDIASKDMAPNPWATDSATNAETAQPHPWELAPLPEGGNVSPAQTDTAPHPWQAAPQPETWQPPQSAATEPALPFYPPPPGPYGYPSTGDSKTYPNR